MNISGWTWDLSLDGLSQQFQENFQKAQELMNQYSLDNLQEDEDKVINREGTSSTATTITLASEQSLSDNEKPSPQEFSQIVYSSSNTNAPAPIEIIRLGPTTSNTSQTRTETKRNVPRVPESNNQSAVPKGFFSDESDVDVENDPIINRSRQRQVNATTKVAEYQSNMKPSLPAQPDIENQIPPRPKQPEDCSKKKAPLTTSIFDKLGGSSRGLFDSLKNSLSRGQGSNAASSSLLSRFSQVKKFYVAVVLLGMLMLFIFWKITVVWGA